jgi:hypothetical protein
VRLGLNVLGVNLMKTIMSDMQTRAEFHSLDFPLCFFCREAGKSSSNLSSESSFLILVFEAWNNTEFFFIMKQKGHVNKAGKLSCRTSLLKYASKSPQNTFTLIRICKCWYFPLNFQSLFSAGYGKLPL